MDPVAMTVGLLGGLSLFLFGMEQMTEALQAAAGEKMKELLGRLTSTRLYGVLTGAFVTAVIQSSSVTTVLVVGFISAGLMTLTQSIGVIMGANLGTTVTGQIVAFKVTKAALPMITVGYGLLFASRRDRTKQWGGMIMGLGLIFFGMGIMSDAMAPLRTYQPFIDLMDQVENPLLGIAISAVFTALVQSSSATTGIVIVMASQGLVTLNAGIALAMGANIGTCVTAALASLGKPRDAKRAATIHILFNILGVLIWVLFIPYLAAMVVAVSPAYADLEGVDRLAAEVPRQIANANTLFNLANTLLFIGFTEHFARVARWVVSDETPKEREGLAPSHYLEVDLIQTPSLALEAVRWEIGRLGEVVVQLLKGYGPASLSKDDAALEELAASEDRVDILRGQILDYLGKVRKQYLTDLESRELQTLMNTCETLEHMADVVSQDLVKLTRRAVEKDLEAGETLQHILDSLYLSVIEAVEGAVKSVQEEDEKAAEAVVVMKERISRQVRETLELQARTLDADDPGRLEVFRIEMETVDDLRRIFTMARRIAKMQLPST
jgi:phosphate:Na+ symporter